MNNLSQENFAEAFGVYIKKNNLKLRKVAIAIGCPILTLERLLKRETYPTNEMIKQTGVLITLGLTTYKKLSKAQKETISETLGTIGGAGIGIGSITATLSTLGYAGLSSAGIMSGLATAGGMVGAGAIGGVIIFAAVPVLAGAAGYGIIKGVKYVVREGKLKSSKFDSHWETLKK